jgi:23S rRNA G2445 N2-methylase RlmL
VKDLGPQSMEGGPGAIVTNPPYGERVAATETLYQEMARSFGKMRGWRIAVLAGSPAIVRPIRLKPVKSLIVFNGDIECRLITYDVPG